MRTLLLPLVGLLLAAVPAAAQQAAFDLAGPSIVASVTRGAETLPVARVPALRAGDRLTVRADLPADQSARYLLVVAFLRGATNPPPKAWFFRAETWKRKKATLSVAVPDGAGQAIAFLAPETGGGFDAVVGAVRGRPGVFVRAAQDLHLASLDRARLEAFVDGVDRLGRQAPERLAAASPRLAGALAIRLNAECLARPRALQAACLTQNRETLVLQSPSGSASLAERLAGTPTDLAYRIAAVPEAGAGYYSPYIALARDLARLFGAFRSAQFQYLPALTVADGAALTLRLATAPSFQNPRSVLVAALPPIGEAPPVLRLGSRTPPCLTRPGLVLPVEGEPLLYATGYATDLRLRVAAADGPVDLPLAPDAERGGLVLAGGRAGFADLPTTAHATLEGRWGFDRLAGVPITVQSARSGGWRAQSAAPVATGRDGPFALAGGGASCVERITLRGADGAEQPVAWTVAGPDTVTATLPLARVRPGRLTLAITEAGGAAPATVDLMAQAEASRLDAFVLHEGDGAGTLSGARLDQVAELRIADARFLPGALTRGDGGDRLALSGDDPPVPLRAGDGREASVRLKDGRTARVRVEVLAARPRLTVLSRSVERPPAAGLRLLLPEGALAPEALLTFSVRLGEGGLGAGGALEVATADGSGRAVLTVASGSVQQVGGDVAVASLRPHEALGPGAAGPLRVRPVRGMVAGDWQALARVVRVPVLSALICRPDAADCTLAGTRLFTLSEVADTPDFARAVRISPGFVGGELILPRPIGQTLYARLSDAPDLVARVVLPPAATAAR